MKKGICFILTAALSVMLLTACGDNRQSGNANDRNQSESSTMQSSEPEAENQEGMDGDDAQPEQADTTGDGQEAENNSSEQAVENTESGQPEASDNAEGQPGKVLVVYYSASGNTKAVAETIAAYTEGDTFEIIPVEEYTSEDLNWTQEGSRVNLEHEDESLQDITLVSTTVEDFDSYDTVFIRYASGITGLN